MLQLIDIRKSYLLGTVEVEVLRGVDLEVDAGDLLSVMGPSGSGKSTLMNIIGLLGRPTDGTFLLDGRDVWSMNDDQLSAFRNRQIGFVFQSFNLMEHLTAIENVGLSLVYRGASPADVRRRSLDMLERVGMGERADHRPGQLSGGQRQRVAIARALVGAPSVILADEPTGALDASTANEVMDLLVELNSRDGITIVIITHDPGVAAKCARQTVIDDGSLVETTAGPH